VAPARSARSTVGTATEIHDYLRLLFARLGTVHCGNCGHPVTADSPSSITREAEAWRAGEPLMVLARGGGLARMAWGAPAEHLVRAGYTGMWIDGAIVALDPTPSLGEDVRSVPLVMDRFTWRSDGRERLAEACEQAFRRGEGRLELVRDGGSPETRSERWEC